MSKSYKSELSSTIHETVADLFEHGIIDKTTMKEFDASCRTPAEILPSEKKHTSRKREKLS